mmetsp:Transcript_5841/g.10108  ORF Transcript_5841/g.10108 Transcript_5841/m.10108 type:complete len:326 (+) Transcript_5841:392-1369(+)
MRPTVLPTTAISRPTFGSLPATAHLNSGELTTALPMARAASSDQHPLTATSSTWLVPSPFRTTSLARSRQIACSAARNSARWASPARGTFREDTSATVSEVDSSLSTLMQLKVTPTAAGSSSRSVARGTATSVSRYTSMVAMLGSIMPAPLAMPTSRPPPGSAAPRSFGYRSVVQMPIAAGTSESCCRESFRAGRFATMSATGNRHPMTPVELGRTAWAPPAKPKVSAMAAQTASESATPFPPGQTLDILLLTTIAWSFSSLRRSRPTRTGDPGNLFLVKQAAKASVGSSRTMAVSFIFALLEGSSTGRNSNPVTPIWKPSGSAA